MKETVVPKCSCPYCGIITDRAGSANGENTPVGGSISICVECTEISLFDDDLTIRRPDLAELTSIQRSAVWPEVERARAAIIKFKELRGL